MRLLSAKDRIARPWKNGGGVTRDVAIAPPDANLDTFDWRISFADGTTSHADDRDLFSTGIAMVRCVRDY